MIAAPSGTTHIIGGVTYKEKTIDINPMIDNTIRPSVGTEVLPTNTERDISGNNRPPLTLAILADEGDISYGVYPEEGSIGAEPGEQRVGDSCQCRVTRHEPGYTH
jgi:hypothetical protein